MDYLNIEDKESLQKYLAAEQGMITQFNDEFEVLKGGVSNKAILYSGEQGAMVVKQALSKLRVKADWFSNPARLKIEADAIKWLNTFLKKDSVPNLIFYDHDNFVMGMEAVPQPHDNFKTLLLNRELSLDLVKQLARLLGKIHSQGSRDPEARRLFGDRSFFKALRIEAYYQYAASQLLQTKGFFESLIQESLGVKKTTVHGDFSPKNILVRNDKLILLDHEVMHWGDPTFDIGFSLCHFLSKANHLKSPDYADAAILYWNEYLNNYSDVDDGFENRATRQLMGCLLARVKGRSPLEYLSAESGLKQVSTVLELIEKEVFSIERFIEMFKIKIIQ